MKNMLLVIFVFMGCSNNIDKGNYYLQKAKADIKTHNYQESKENFLVSCEKYNNSEACWNLGFRYEFGLDKENTNELEGFRYYKKACDNNYPEACWNLGIMYDSGKANLNNEEYAYVLYEKSCKEKFAESCTTLGIKYEENKKDAVKAKYYYKMGCDLGDNDACMKLKSFH